MAHKIDLGTTHSKKESYPTVSDNKDKTFFPSFHVTGKKELHDMPDEFDGHAHFKVVHRSKSKRDGQPETYSHEIEIHHISHDGKKTPKPDAGEDLDSALTKIEEKKAQKTGKHADPDGDGD